MDIPLVASYIQFSDANWKYKTEPNLQACLGMAGHQCNYPRGKALGGSSLLNFMIHSRGNRRDYDGWAALGNEGWAYRDVLPYFKKSESVHRDVGADPRFRGARGPHPVTLPSWRTPLAEAFVQAGPATGQRLAKDYNGETQTGFSYLQVSMLNGTRVSEARAYLSPVRSRRNLFVRKQALVTRVLIHPVLGQAYGVQYMQGRRNVTVFARKEVIICGGAINSPQLLMLSGVGPREDLEAVGVAVQHHLPGVGRHLEDHIALGGLTFLVNQSVSLRTERLYSNPRFFSEYLSYHTGPASIPGGCEAVAFYDLQRPADPDGYPDLELLFQGGSLTAEPVMRKAFGIDEELFDAVFKPVEHLDSWMVFPMLLRPRSRGRLTLRSWDPLKPPAIYPNYFEHQQDLDVIIEGVKKAIQVAQSEPFKRFGTRLHDIPIPACKR
ncbi:Glucose dehydrogenase acceptor-like [Frankliniella occidentalis]|nr:Glucose dehydrogenase acceptor-like [Frankliniella occidentalis]